MVKLAGLLALDATMQKTLQLAQICRVIMWRSGNHSDGKYT